MLVCYRILHVSSRVSTFDSFFTRLLQNNEYEISRRNARSVCFECGLFLGLSVDLHNISHIRYKQYLEQQILDHLIFSLYNR